MTSITIISGGLGTGKTILSKTLAHAEPAGLHFVTDTMHDALTELGEYEQHVIETTERSPEEVRAEYLDRRRRGEFRLDTRVLTP